MTLVMICSVRRIAGLVDQANIQRICREAEGTYLYIWCCNTTESSIGSEAMFLY